MLLLSLLMGSACGDWEGFGGVGFGSGGGGPPPKLEPIPWPEGHVVRGHVLHAAEAVDFATIEVALHAVPYPLDPPQAQELGPVLAIAEVNPEKGTFRAEFDDFPEGWSRSLVTVRTDDAPDTETDMLVPTARETSARRYEEGGKNAYLLEQGRLASWEASIAAEPGAILEGGCTIVLFAQILDSAPVADVVFEVTGGVPYVVSEDGLALLADTDSTTAFGAVVILPDDPSVPPLIEATHATINFATMPQPALLADHCHVATWPGHPLLAE